MLGFFHSKNAWNGTKKKTKIGAEESSQIYISVLRMAPKFMLKKSKDILWPRIPPNEVRKIKPKVCQE